MGAPFSFGFLEGWLGSLPHVQSLGEKLIVAATLEGIHLERPAADRVERTFVIPECARYGGSWRFASPNYFRR
jgi:hypothetical protein